MAEKAPRGVRLVIALAGRRNAGKSTCINALASQEIAIVSPSPGTTTDPVAKHYELPPLGPVTFYDTPGLDDVGELGLLRVQAARRVFLRSDLAVLVVGAAGVGEPERRTLQELQELGLPVLAALNKSDCKRDEYAPSLEHDLAFFRERNVPCHVLSALHGEGVDALKAGIVASVPEELRREPPLVGDLIREGDWVLCVAPIDLAAPKGRLILPQVQVLRDVLDCDALGAIVKERELEEALAGLRRRPALVVTDSQAVLKVAGDVPRDVPLTTFSILFARFKGDLPLMVQGARAIDTLQNGDSVLMAEACSHHAVADDIGRVKIPRWITQYTGLDLDFHMAAGNDFPEDLERYALVVHCGACMLNRAAMLRRLRECRRRGVPVTNYGVAISKVQGLLERVVAPFGLEL